MRQRVINAGSSCVRLRQGKPARILGAISTALLAVIVSAWPVFADGDGHLHDTPASGFDSEPLLWGTLALSGMLLLFSLFQLIRGRWRSQESAAPETALSYLAAVRRFGRNARLFLGYSLVAELGGGIWSVMFNFYLLRLGFPITFVGTFWLVNMLCHAAGALPAGVIADRYGRRRAFFTATCIALVAQGGLLLMQDPVAILALGAVAGFGEAFHGVTGPPFMADNSEPAERPYLFSLNASFLQLSRFGGSLAGGVLPLVWATTLGIPPLDPGAARWALLSGLPLTLLALTPLALMRERPVEFVEGFTDLVTLRNVVHPARIAQLTLLGLMVGTAFGLTARFFNLFFQEARSASDAQVGAILAVGAVASGSAVLISPALAQGYGKVRSILLTQACSVPFLLAMALVPSLSAVTAFFVVRSALYGLSLPLRNQLAMDLVVSRERGTTAGFTHTAFDIGGGVGAGVAGLLITDGGFLAAFAVAAALILVPAYLCYAFFSAMDTRERSAKQIQAPIVARPGLPRRWATQLPRWVSAACLRGRRLRKGRRCWSWLSRSWFLCLERSGAQSGRASRIRASHSRLFRWQTP